MYNLIVLMENGSRVFMEKGFDSFDEAFMYAADHYADPEFAGAIQFEIVPGYRGV
jgi:hypothetical protein